MPDQNQVWVNYCLSNNPELSIICSLSKRTSTETRRSHHNYPSRHSYMNTVSHRVHWNQCSAKLRTITDRPIYICSYLEWFSPRETAIRQMPCDVSMSPFLMASRNCSCSCNTCGTNFRRVSTYLKHMDTMFRTQHETALALATQFL